MSEHSPGLVSPRARLAMWWGLLLVVGLVAFVALRPDDAGIADGAPPPSPSDTAGPGGTASDGTIGVEAGGDDPAVGDTDGSDGSTPPTAAPTTTATSGEGGGGEAAFDGQEPDDTSPNTATTQPLDEQGCLPGYAGACLPPAPPVLTCADIAERGILVTGPDPHGLDDDFDGTACPSELPPATTAPGTPADPLD